MLISSVRLVDEGDFGILWAYSWRWICITRQDGRVGSVRVTQLKYSPCEKKTFLSSWCKTLCLDHLKVAAAKRRQSPGGSGWVRCGHLLQLKEWIPGPHCVPASKWRVWGASSTRLIDFASITSFFFFSLSCLLVSFFLPHATAICFWYLRPQLSLLRFRPASQPQTT